MAGEATTAGTAAARIGVRVPERSWRGDARAINIVWQR